MNDNDGPSAGLVYVLYCFLGVRHDWVHGDRRILHVPQIPKGSSETRWQIQARLAELLGRDEPAYVA
ncbi:hypothetical protein D3C84_1265750 [compost metagenome]